MPLIDAFLYVVKVDLYIFIYLLQNKVIEKYTIYTVKEAAKKFLH